MAIYNDASKLIPYTPKGYPSLDGGVERFISTELGKIQKSIAQIITVMKLQEDRMNANRLS